MTWVQAAAPLEVDSLLWPSSGSYRWICTRCNRKSRWSSNENYIDLKAIEHEDLCRDHQ